ncbi:hypothetical protein PAPYR_1935 [Paratrimastix pyriformis]|uniref:Uncharacterized protein n=1 Tax=Paratrimastix pyriformis TaxID=342808 RepID=A0ABQ8URN5_9EUKA|nr:hypothetical protein PAPYR_1935 [Paratrimastix pyriformis]
MERVTECLVTKDEREVIAVVLFSWPIGPTTPDGSVLVPASMLKGASAPLRPCTSGSRCGVLRADWGLPAPLQNVSVGSTNARPRPLHPIDETDTLAAVPFGTPLGAREETPRVFLLPYSVLCGAVLPGWDHTSHTDANYTESIWLGGPVFRVSARLRARTAEFSHEGAPLDFRMPSASVCTLTHQHRDDGMHAPLVFMRAIRGMFGCGARGYTNTGKNWCYALAPVHARYVHQGRA